MVFSVIMYSCESWTIKKEKRWRTYAFRTWCWRRLLESPLDCRRSNQLVLKEIKHEYSLEGLRLKLKLQYLGHLMQRTDSLEKILILGKTEGRRREWQRMRWWVASPIQWTWTWVNSRRWWRAGREAWPDAVHGLGHDLVTQQQQQGDSWKQKSLHSTQP